MFQKLKDSYNMLPFYSLLRVGLLLVGSLVHLQGIIDKEEEKVHKGGRGFNQGALQIAREGQVTSQHRVLRNSKSGFRFSSCT
jgi:hypothetical protein